MGKSIVTGRIPISTSSTITGGKKALWRVKDFEILIQSQGYPAYIDKAMRCPCVEKVSGSPQSTCKNCLGRGYFFIDRKQATVISQSMNNKKHQENFGETNKGIARITTKGVDKLSFMDRIILLPLIAYYQEVIRPISYEDELIAYPIYEPIDITNIFLFKEGGVKLVNLTPDQYSIEDNKIIFVDEIRDLLPVEDINNPTPVISIAIRYSYHPVYHVIEGNRELMKVHGRKQCSPSSGKFQDMPNNVLAKKAHFIFDAQKYDEELFDNTVYPE